jgi:chemotaxis protein methyltransferase CheR
MAFTFFFRDAETLAAAVACALPAMQGQCYIHIWDAGCAHGPEPYTLAVLLRRQMSDFLFRNVRIHATDIDAGFGKQVADGIYPEAELRRMPPDVFREYFRETADPGLFQISHEIRSRIEFSKHDLLSLQPIREGLTLIVCKNVLLHFSEQQRIAVLRMFHQSLRADGLLVMEHTQKMPEPLRPCFEQVTAEAQIYRKRETKPEKQMRIDAGARPAGGAIRLSSTAEEGAGRESLVHG